MKNAILRFLCSSIFTILAIACQSDSESHVLQEPVWDDATLVAYANVDQLYSKSDIVNLNIDSLLTNTTLKHLLRNPKDSGIAIDKPVYITVREMQSVMALPYITVSAEVSDIAKLDATLKAIGGDADKSDVALEGERRIIRIDNEVVLGYDTKRLMVLTCEDENCDHHKLLNTLLDYAPADMSRFAGYDIALYTDLRKAIDKALYASANELGEATELMEQYQEFIDEDANATCGLTFETGAVTLSSDIAGIKEDTLNSLKSSKAKHLRLLPPSPIALLNISINGEAVAEVLNTAVDTMLATSDSNAINEVNIFKNIALGIVGSIDGDLIIALSDANGKLMEDEISGSRLVFTTANATLAADVKDDYIIKNVETYAGSFLTKQGKGKYSAEMFGNKLNIGQQDNLFYIGVNNTVDIKQQSVADEEWSNNVYGSYLYAMVDFNRLFNSGFGRAALSGFYKNSSADRIQNIKTFVNNVDRCYALVNRNEQDLHSELTVTLKNRSTNSLKQFVEIVYNQANQ